MSAHRVLVTGVNGFVGGHLVSELVAAGEEVVGVGRGEVSTDLASMLSVYLDHDLTQSWPDVDGVDRVVHLAALSAVGPSFDAPQDYLMTNSSMVTHLGEHELRHGSFDRVVVVSSGAVYDPHQPMPIAEDGRLGFHSPYTVSKILVENLARYYVGRGLDWVVARPFNHLGPGQGPGFLLPDLYAGIRDAEKGGTPLRAGDLSTRRDFSDVRDVARAYRLLLEADALHHRVYNVCSSRDLSGEDMLAELRRLGAGVDVDVEVDRSLLRPNDPARIVGDGARLRMETGWQPRYRLPESVADFTASRPAGDRSDIG